MVHKKYLVVIVAALLLMSVHDILAQRYMERLDRGLVAVKTDADRVFISWRLYGTDPDGIGFNVYRDAVKVNPKLITDRTNYVDTSGSLTALYSIKPVVNGQEQGGTEAVSVWSEQYTKIPLQVPSGGTTPDTVNYTYSPNDASVGDIDGDGAYEIVLKWDPSNSKDNSQAGYTGNVYLDAYEFDGKQLWRIDLGKNIRAGAHYTQFMVYDLNSDGFTEIACKTAPGTKDGTGAFLKSGPAANDNDNADYRNTSGYILTGPEYCTVFAGKTGAELYTANYLPARGTVADWGDGYGNRVDRFLACIAYLDGKRPSLVLCRGYYTRSVLAAWDWDGKELKSRWVFDGKNNTAYNGQGNHNLSVADVDQDGFDEIVYGSCTIDHTGNGLYTTGLGHGDALHVSDFNPDRPGLEVWQCHESGGNGASFRDAKTGSVIFQFKVDKDCGRALIADITAAHKGAECWAGSGCPLYTSMGTDIGAALGTANFTVWWDGDALRELLDGIAITKYGGGTLLTAANCAANNGTKATPCLQADILGDWREEVIWRNSNNKELLVYTTTTPTAYRIYTLMHDPHYRISIAWQNVAYNQPPHTGFFLGDGMTSAPKPNIVYPDNTAISSSMEYNSGHRCRNTAITVFSGRTFMLPEQLHGKLATVKVYDLSGKLVKEIITGKKGVNLKESAISRGVYIVHVFENSAQPIKGKK